MDNSDSSETNPGKSIELSPFFRSAGEQNLGRMESHISNERRKSDRSHRASASFISNTLGLARKSSLASAHDNRHIEEEEHANDKNLKYDFLHRNC